MLTARSSRFADMIIWYSGFSQLSGLPHSLGNTPLSARNYHRSAILAASEATVSELHLEPDESMPNSRRRGDCTGTGWWICFVLGEGTIQHTLREQVWYQYIIDRDELRDQCVPTLIDNLEFSRRSFSVQKIAFRDRGETSGQALGSHGIRKPSLSSHFKAHGDVQGGKENMIRIPLTQTIPRDLNHHAKRNVQNIVPSYAMRESIRSASERRAFLVWGGHRKAVGLGWAYCSQYDELSNVGLIRSAVIPRHLDP
ncbi:hypothetical protein CIB48_g10046 [Xylaria polymorpha]|nr:hypothetical protein CIB48_g10046 [Xylaria polymorpha]